MQQLSASSRTPPAVVIGLLCLGFLLLQFDEEGFSGWLRVATICATALGFCLLTLVTAYWITWRRKGRPRPFVSKLIYAGCAVACGWSLYHGVRDTRNALDPDHWLEISMEHADLPFEVGRDQTFYTLDLDPKATDGLHQIQGMSNQTLLWPEDRRPTKGNELYWLGWLCTIRNRGMQRLSDITFDVPVSYTYDSEHEPRNWTIHHVNIPVLNSNQDLKLLLGSGRENVYVEVYKPKVVLLQVGDETRKRPLRTLLLPFDKHWDREHYWFLSGPLELPSHEDPESKQPSH